MIKKVTVCLCTYKRVQLAETLLSLANQTLADNIVFNVSVADNDPDGSGKSIVDTFTHHYPIDVTYQVQPQKNIALTRNMTIVNADGEYLAFIDDDEQADPLWLQTLVECAEKYSADAVIGKVNTIYPDETPNWIRDGDLFGKEIAATGSSLITGATSNALVRRAALPQRETPFKPELGTSGGEDSELFYAIHQSGGKIVACQEAVVSETVETQRLNAEYLLRRSTGIGESYAHIFIAQKPFLERQWHCLRAAIQALVAGIIATLSKPVSDSYSFRFKMAMNANWGKVRYLINTPQVELYK